MVMKYDGKMVVRVCWYDGYEVWWYDGKMVVRVCWYDGGEVRW